MACARLRRDRSASCCLRVCIMSWYLFRLGRVIVFHLCSGCRAFKLHGCNYCWNGYYQMRGRPRRHGRPGRAYCVEMAGSAEPAILPRSVRTIRPSSKVGVVGRSVPPSSTPPLRPYRQGTACAGGSVSLLITVMFQTRHSFHNTPKYFINSCGVAVSAVNISSATVPTRR